MSALHRAEPERRYFAWASLGLHSHWVAAALQAGFRRPTETQRSLIPHALRGRDCLLQASGGTGKTLAFTLPMLQAIRPDQGVQAIVLAATRDLARQVERHIRLLTAHGSGRADASGPACQVQAALVLDDASPTQQAAVLRRQPHVVIGLPGPLRELVEQKELSLAEVKLAVLDEVDRMLEMGLEESIRRVLSGIPTQHQTILVSATIDQRIRELAQTFMRDPVEVSAPDKAAAIENLRQSIVRVQPEDRFRTLVALLSHEPCKLAIVLANTQQQAQHLAEDLRQQQVNSRLIGRRPTQQDRQWLRDSLRAAKMAVLVAADDHIAWRHLGVADVDHVINYQVPEEPELYVRRVAAAAKTGRPVAVFTLATAEESRLVSEIEKRIGKPLLAFEPAWLPKSPATGPAPAGEAARQPTQVTPSRLIHPRHRDPVFEALGLRPVKRTLGSRFPTARRFRR